MFAFVKTDSSFHGVEPIVDAEVSRYLLLYDLRVKSRGSRLQPMSHAH
jgi:hypothetical protein